MSEIHSESYLTDDRDQWWNPDYLHLIRQRFNLVDCHNFLDIGCGAGHWTKIVASNVAEKAEAAVLDFEEKWVRKTVSVLKKLGKENTVGVVGDAHTLPFPDDTFDLVTCQTLLMHVKDPLKVVSEMYRVAEPGGKIVVVESENLLSALAQTSLDFAEHINERILIHEFWLRYEEGKRKCGEGNNSVGAVLPGIFKEAGLLHCKFYLNDRLQPEVIEQVRQSNAESFVNKENDLFTEAKGHWNLATLRRYLAASGCAEKRMALLIDAITLHHQKIMKNTSTYVTAGIACMILGYGEKQKISASRTG